MINEPVNFKPNRQFLISCFFNFISVFSKVRGPFWEGEGGGRRCCHRPQNKQICVPQNADFFKEVSKAAELILAGAADL